MVHRPSMHGLSSLTGQLCDSPLVNFGFSMAFCIQVYLKMDRVDKAELQLKV